MQLHLQILSDDERSQVHERTLKILAKQGVHVLSARARQILRKAGAEVIETTQQVRFPRSLVEDTLRLAPKEFSLGSRRPGKNLQLNQGESFLLADGGAISVLDVETGTHHPAQKDDWVKSTLLIDALDEIDLYWWMARDANCIRSPGDFVVYWRDVFSNTSKHVQDSTEDIAQSRWLLEILQVVFGDRKTIRRLHPFSYLLCPVSPLTIDEKYTDAYLEVGGWNIPAVLMPMPLMGTTAPGSLISTILLGNCETLAMLCLVQAAEPGTPSIYAPALAVAEPRSGRYGSGAVEHSLLGAAVTEMARYYGLPVEASVGGTDHHRPGIQAAYERALNWSLPLLSWPDILVGPGLLSGSTVLCYEQILIDLEIFQRSRRLHDGIDSQETKWLDKVIEKVGSGGNFLAQRSTRDGLHSGEWYISQLGYHGSLENWEEKQNPNLLEQARQKIEKILSEHKPLPLDEQAVLELERIERRASLPRATT